MAATGGFLREGATTLMIGTQDEEVETVLGIIRKQIPTEKETDKQHATIFVIDVKNFQRI